MTNKEIALLFKHVAAAYSIKNESKYRFQILAYQKAAETIENSPTEIKDLIIDNKLDDLPGIGASIKQHLEELNKTGKVKHFESILKHVPKAMFPLLDVPTFGPKKALKLVTHFGLTKPETVIEDLKSLAEQGKIASLEGFGEKSQADIVRAVSEYKQGKGKTTRMVLPFAFEVAEKVLDYLKKSPDVIIASPLGSLRRMVSTIGDIDVAVSTNKPEKVLDYFVAYPYKERVIERGECGASLLVSSGRQIDLLTQPPDRFGSLLQHFTGSKNHNVHLREYAIKKGLSLSERGIKNKKDDKIKSFDTEEKFYKALGMDWIPPEIREDKGEIELALSHKLPKLIELKDIKGDFHIHSSFSIEPSHDMGEDSMQDMLDKGKSLGYEYLGFSEHNPSISKHTKQQIYSIMQRRKNKIEQLNKSNKSIRTISLLEIDILANSNLALDTKSLELLDGAIVSIHSSFAMSKKDMTKRILNGLSHPKAKIFAHPTGRLLNERPGYEVDFDELFDFCKKHNKALEINGWPNRLDLPDSLVKEAVAQGVKMVIDTDSHALWQMDMMKYGVAVARRGWAQKHDILNTLGYNDLIKWLHLE